MDIKIKHLLLISTGAFILAACGDNSAPTKLDGASALTKSERANPEPTAQEIARGTHYSPASRYGVHPPQKADQGSQFTSWQWIDTLKQAGIKISMDGKGRFLDNIFIPRGQATHANGSGVP